MKKTNQSGYMKWIIGLGIIALAIGVSSTLKFGDSLVYFYTPKEAQQKAAQLMNQTIQVGGMVKGGSVQSDSQKLKWDFVMTDLKGTEILAHYEGTPPDMFKENSGVIVEGRISGDGQKIVARNLMVKHSEEYKKPGDHSKMNQALIEKSMFKNEELEEKDEGKTNY